MHNGNGKEDHGEHNGGAHCTSWPLRLFAPPACCALELARVALCRRDLFDLSLPDPLRCHLKCLSEARHNPLLRKGALGTSSSSCVAMKKSGYIKHLPQTLLICGAACSVLLLFAMMFSGSPSDSSAAQASKPAPPSICFNIYGYNECPWFRRARCIAEEFKKDRPDVDLRGGGSYTLEELTRVV